MIVAIFERRYPVVFNRESEAEGTVHQTEPAIVSNESEAVVVRCPDAVELRVEHPVSLDVYETAGTVLVAHGAEPVLEDIAHSLGVIEPERKNSLVLGIDEAYLAVLHRCCHTVGEDPCLLVLFRYDDLSVQSVYISSLVIAAEYGESVGWIRTGHPVNIFYCVFLSGFIVHAEFSASIVESVYGDILRQPLRCVMLVPFLISDNDEDDSYHHAADDEESKERKKDLLDDFECFFQCSIHICFTFRLTQRYCPRTKWLFVVFIFKEGLVFRTCVKESVRYS